MKVINKNIDDIYRYEDNPRNNSTAVDGVADSIKNYGFQQPIVVDKNNIIIAGDTRYLASQKLGLKTVPVVVADISPEKAKEFRLVDNRTGELSRWDIDKLFDQLDETDAEELFTGFRFKQLLSSAGKMVEEAQKRNDDVMSESSKVVRITVMDNEELANKIGKILQEEFSDHAQIEVRRWN